MNPTRQDAWTKEEDKILAETVLTYIREGKTQLDAFKDVGKKLTRTAAACGFRWNATIRKQHEKAIEEAKKARKNFHPKELQKGETKLPEENYDPIDTAILLLKNMKVNAQDHNISSKKEEIQKLRDENEQLKKLLRHYDEVWKEMGNLWKWLENKKASYLNKTNIVQEESFKGFNS